MTTKISLTVPNQGEGRLVTETLDAHERGPNLYELAYSPGLIEGLAAGDVVSLNDDTPSGYRLVKRGGNVSAWFFFREEGQNRAEPASDLARRVQPLGGRLDGGGKFSLVFTIPATAGFPSIEAVFNRAAARIPGSTWMFSNVYDPADGKTPLNWWAE